MTADSAAEPGAWAGEEADVTGEPVRQIVHVDGTPMSALVLAVPQPRAVLVALHGGAVTAAYYDATYPTPHTSLLRVAAALGYTAIALDRPGYGSSAAHQEHMATPADRVNLTYGAIERLLDGRPGGAGVFLAGHSAGCMLVTRMAADPRGAELLGLEIAGIGLSPHADAAFMTPLVNGADSARPQAPGPELQEALWKPRRLYPPRASLSLRYAVSPRYEGSEVRSWVGAFPGLAALVRVPVHYTVGDHERVWSSGPAALAQVGALFTASPRVVTVEQADAAHNLSLGWTALSYHLKVLSFLEECVVTRQHSSLPAQPGPLHASRHQLSIGSGQISEPPIRSGHFPARFAAYARPKLIRRRGGARPAAAAAGDHRNSVCSPGAGLDGAGGPCSCPARCACRNRLPISYDQGFDFPSVTTIFSPGLGGNVQQ